MSVADIFNEMAGEYDEIRDLWYAWLYSRLHFIIAKDVIKMYSPKTVLDVGCGTGFQSFLHAAAGASVVGIDIAEDLIKVARRKASSFNPNSGIVLFPVYFDFVDRYNKLISDLLIEKVRASKFTPPIFKVADAVNLPFPDNTFDHVNCCGSTLSFVEKHQQALSEIARVLRPGGTFLLEVESRWNIDLFWMLIDCFLKGRLGYQTPIKEALRAIFTPPSEYISVDYPFGDPQNSVYMKIKLFTEGGLNHELSNLGFKVLKRYSIHSMTNLIPSPYLDTNDPPKWLINLFTFYASIEEKIPFYLPGCSLVFLARKEEK